MWLHRNNMIFVDGKQQKHNESTKSHATNMKIISICCGQHGEDLLRRRSSSVPAAAAVALNGLEKSEQMAEVDLRRGAAAAAAPARRARAGTRGGRGSLRSRRPRRRAAHGVRDSPSLRA